MLGHILPVGELVTGNSGPLIARTSWLWICLLQLSLWSCQLLASLDNSLTQYGSVCPVRGLIYSWRIKRFGIEQNLCVTAIKKVS